MNGLTAVTNKPFRARVRLSDRTFRDIFVKVTGKQVTHNKRAVHTTLPKVTYTLADDVVVHLRTDPDSGFMVHVTTKRQEYVNLKHGAWYSFVVESSRSVTIVAVEMYCNYRADGKKPLRVLYNVTNASGIPPRPVAPVGIPDGYKAPTAATDRKPADAKSKQRKKNKLPSTRKPKREIKGPKRRREYVQRPEPNIARPVLLEPPQARPSHRTRRSRHASQNLNIEQLIAAVAEDMKRAMGE